MMSGYAATSSSGVAPVALPTLTPTKLPASPAKSTPQTAIKSRVKNTPRRGKLPGSAVRSTTPLEQTLYTQANRSTPNAARATDRSVSTPSVPVLLNSQPCNVLLVNGAPTSSAQTNFIQNAQVCKTQTKIVYTNAPVVLTPQSKTQAEVRSEVPTLQIKPKTKPKPVVQKNKPVRPKVQNPVMINLETPTSSTENFVIPNQSLTFHPNPVETPTSVGYTINITDILPPKPNQQKCPTGLPKSKPSQRGSNSPAVPGSSVAQPKDSISVKPQSKIMASKPLQIAQGNSQASYFQFQATNPEDIPTVIPITILGPSPQPITIDSGNTQFIAQALPQLVPFQTLAPSQDLPKLGKLPDGMDNAIVESVEVVDVTEDEATLRTVGSNAGEIHHGLTKSVPEPYAADILSHLTSDGALPAISSSQVCSVLSALDAPQHTENLFHEQLQSPPKNTKNRPLLRKSSRKLEVQSKRTTRQKQKDEVAAKKKEEARLKATNKLVERVQCFKCRFCLFLTLDQVAVTKHIEEEHSSHLSKPKDNGDVIPCPGCNNVFVSEKSLSVHLSEDHKVALRELNDIMSTLVGSKHHFEEESPKKVKREKTKRSPRNSAKIRVRNLMKDATPEAEATVERPNFKIPAERIPEVPVLEDKPQQIEYDYDDHDYATAFHDSDDGSVNGNVKKRGRRRRKSAPRKKRKANTENEEEPRFVQTGYKCNVSFCGVRMTSHDNLVYHQRCHKKDGPSDAKTVNEGTKGSEAEAKSVKSRKTEYLCPECNIRMKSWVQMSGHLWRYHGIDMELHSCDQCEYKTPSLANLVNLHQRIHGSERPFACDACDKSFKTTKQLRNHKVIHANKIKAAAGDVCACDLCGRRFIDNRLLRSHISAVHNKLKPFNCQTCGYSASNRSTLKMHLRLHTGEKPFHCDECSYTTADHNSLRRHKKRHSGDKPYKCPYCFYACIQSSTYKVHLRTKHSGQGEGLMFSCQSCPFHTVSQDIYKAHVAQHKAGEATTNSNKTATRRPKARIRANNEENSSHAVATAAVSEPLPIIISFSTEDAHGSEAPTMQNVVEEVSEAIIPGSDLHLLYSNFAGLNQHQSTETTANVVYGSQTSEFVMSVLSDSVIQVVEERNNDNDASVVAIAEERITGDLGELQENTEDLKFKLCEELRS